MSEANDLPPQPPKKSALLRTLILLGVLVLIVAGGLWDMYGAKEPRDEAYNRVLALQGSSGTYDSGQAATTQAEVQKAVGTKPSESTTEGAVIYERYSWRRGIPWMTYDLWVLYRGDDRKEMLVAQLGEEGKPDPIYAANSQDAKAPMPDPSTVRPIVDGESPYPPPRVDPPAEEEASAEATDDSDSPAPPASDAPAEASEGDSTETSEEKPAATTPADSAAEPDASPEASTSEESEGETTTP